MPFLAHLRESTAVTQSMMTCQYHTTAPVHWSIVQHPGRQDVRSKGQVGFDTETGTIGTQTVS